MVAILDKNSKSYLNASVKAAAYMPIIQQVSENVFKVQSETNPRLFYTVTLFGTDRADCNCYAGVRGQTCKHVVAAQAWKQLHTAVTYCLRCEKVEVEPGLEFCSPCYDEATTGEPVVEVEPEYPAYPEWVEPVQTDFCKIMFVDTVWITAYLIGNPAGEKLVEARIYNRKTQDWSDVTMTVEQYIEQIDLNGFQLAMAVNSFEAKVAANEKLIDRCADWQATGGY